jgi:hypothetical protein
MPAEKKMEKRNPGVNRPRKITLLPNFLKYARTRRCRRGVKYRRAQFRARTRCPHHRPRRKAKVSPTSTAVKQTAKAQCRFSTPL